MGKVREAIPLGMATIIGVLAVLGVEGDLLDRFIRDHPNQVAIAFSSGVIGVTVPLIAKAKDAVTRVGIALVAIGAGVAIWTGAVGVGEREQPDITLTPLAVDPQTGQVSFQIEALGTHLRSKDRMLLRVSGASGKDPRKRCGNAGFGTEGVEEAYWGESGPNLRGEASTTATITLSSKPHRFACAYAALTGSKKPNVKDPRQTTVLLDLNKAAVPAKALSP